MGISGGDLTHDLVGEEWNDNKSSSNNNNNSSSSSNNKSNNNHSNNNNSNSNVDKEYKAEIVWPVLTKIVIMHFVAALALLRLSSFCWQTIAFTLVCIPLSGMGMTAGAHRLWSHRSYKARLLLRLFLMAANCMCMQVSIYSWVRDHRAHHKFSETDADPKNAKRGFFYAHIGCLFLRKHPFVTREGSKIDLSDLKNDPVVMFQHHHYPTLSILFSLILPTLIPHHFWAESLFNAFLAAGFRFVYIFHSTMLINSVAHMWGNKPYDVNIGPTDNRLISLLCAGEGFHNYHHTFPQDYSTSEWRYSLNATTFFIDVCSWLGLAYERKSVPIEVVQMRAKRTGENKNVGVETTEWEEKQF